MSQDCVDERCEASAAQPVAVPVKLRVTFDEPAGKFGEVS
jgi:hypothetical protein